MDDYISNDSNNPINNKDDIDWCIKCQSNEVYDNDLCRECLYKNHSECCGAELIGEYKDIGICPECKDHL
jgi:hypothetical protein